MRVLLLLLAACATAAVRGLNVTALRPASSSNVTRAATPPPFYYETHGSFGDRDYHRRERQQPPPKSLDLALWATLAVAVAGGGVLLLAHSY